MSTRLARWGLSGALLGAVSVWVDISALAQTLRSVHWGWVVVGLSLGVLQILASAMRWRYTARRLNVRLPLTPAIREYFLSTLTNQLLPGGVIGDANRAWRHHRVQSGADARSAVHAVILERLSGQVILFPWVLLVLAFSVPAQQPGLVSLPGLLPLVSALLITALIVGWLTRRAARQLGADLTRAFWPASVLSVQLGSSLVVVGSYALLFAVCARALNASPGTGWMLAFAPVVLLAMLIPITVSGWGLREGAAAGLWAAYGWPPSEGVAVSVLYGVLVLASSLPGFAALWWPKRA